MKMGGKWLAPCGLVSLPFSDEDIARREFRILMTASSQFFESGRTDSYGVDSCARTTGFVDDIDT